MRLAVVREGRTLLYIPDPEVAIAPHGSVEPAWLDVFYNPVMEFNRDVSVAAVAAFLKAYWEKPDPLILDVHTGTGARGTRYLVEASSSAHAILNDISGLAARLAAENLRLNGVADRGLVTVRDASSLMYSLKREEPTPVAVIDLDPYGSPAPFAWAAAALAGHGSMLAATATDLAVLEGSRPAAAARKYQARVMRTPVAKEVAIRVLLGFIARAAAFNDKAVSVLMAYYADHYVRVYLRVERGARRADHMLAENIGNAYYCAERGYIVFEREACKGASVELGPLWRGRLADEAFLEAVESEASPLTLGTATRVAKLLSALRAEASLTEGLFAYSIEGLARAARTSMPRRDDLLEELRRRGYKAVRSHLSPTIFRSDAPPEEVIDSIITLSHRHS